MSVHELLQQAKAEGITLELEGSRVTWKADHQPPLNLLNSLKAHREEVVDVLASGMAKERAWLANVARLLSCSPTYLLAKGFLTTTDLNEYCSAHPKFAARLIRSHPEWSPPVKLEVEASEPSEDGKLLTVNPNAVSDSLEWTEARNNWHRHLFVCRACYAPTGRYCAKGAELRARYESVSLKTTS